MLLMQANKKNEKKVMALEEASEGVFSGQGTYAIGFHDGTESARFTVYGFHELLICWEEFCSQRGINKDDVSFVTRKED